MGARAEATDATRQRILDAATEQMLARWYDEVTVRSIADAAGVTGQTVLNHFGSKEGLLAEVAAAMDERITAQRDVQPGDVDGAIEALVGDYEETGDAVIRMLALEPRVAALAPHLATGRAMHREWVARTFGASGELLALLVVATDVYTWKLLRRDQRLSRARTIAAMGRLVHRLIDQEGRSR